MAAKKQKVSEFPTYKNKPLVRCGDIIYYGSMAEQYVIQLQIKNKINAFGMEIADKVSIKLLSTDSTLTPDKQVIKSAEKSGLYEALDVADAWLSRTSAS